MAFIDNVCICRRDSVSRSDTSGSSAGDLGEITPCNASPHMTGMISYRVPIRDEVEDQWRRNIETLLFNPATNYAPELLMQLYRVVKVCVKRKKNFYDLNIIWSHIIFRSIVGINTEIYNHC